MSPTKKVLCILLASATLVGCTGNDESLQQAIDESIQASESQDDTSSDTPTKVYSVVELEPIDDKYLASESESVTVAQNTDETTGLRIQDLQTEPIYALLDTSLTNWETPRGEYYLRANDTRPLQYYGYQLPLHITEFNIDPSTIVTMYTNYGDTLTSGGVGRVLVYTYKEGVGQVYTAIEGSVELMPLTTDTTLVQDFNQVINNVR